jgi:hypothetical protein
VQRQPGQASEKDSGVGTGGTRACATAEVCSDLVLRLRVAILAIFSTLVPTSLESVRLRESFLHRLLPKWGDTLRVEERIL